MITCTLNGKTYTVDYVKARALREMGPASEMYTRITRISEAAAKGAAIDEQLTVADAMDVMIKWFCVLFDGQFTPDDVYEHYPADRIMHDVSLALMAVQAQATHVLSKFPTQPTAE